jgi:hypothetical protein
MKSSVKSRAKGSMYGLSADDAMGAPVEFRPVASWFLWLSIVMEVLLSSRLGNGRVIRLMALDLAVSLIKCNGLDAKDQ